MTRRAKAAEIGGEKELDPCNPGDPPWGQACEKSLEAERSEVPWGIQDIADPGGSEKHLVVRLNLD